MASVSGATSSLGNTALKGFGGLASGIDRDSLIQQMTSGTTSRITKQKQAMQKLMWKQEAFRTVSGKILDIQDKYLSYSATSSLKDSALFARNQITALGNAINSKYIKASGTSDLVDQLSILGVKQLATSSSILSDPTQAGSIDTTVTADKLANGEIKTSELEGTKLIFGNYNAADGKFTEAVSFQFPSSYTKKNADGSTETVEIDYTAEPEKVVEQLNEALKSQNFLAKEGKEGSGIEFTYDKATGKLGMKKNDDIISDAGKTYTIRGNSTALEALGFDKAKLTEDQLKDGISIDEFNESTSKSDKTFADTYISKEKFSDYMVGKTIDITYGGQTKTIELMTEEDKKALDKLRDEGKTDEEVFNAFKDTLQKRIDRAFGSGKISIGDTNGALSFSTDDGKSLIVNTNDLTLRKEMGIEANQSNRISLDASLAANGLAGNADSNGNVKITINGVTLDGVTKDTTVRELINKINANEEMGVKASYVAETGQFSLVAKETGSGRDIELEKGGAAETIFGGTVKTGQDAIITVDYGNGVTTNLTSSSNTFDLEGLSVTVSGTFGKYNGDTIVEDKTEAVTFGASANVDAVTETVKKFFEDYNDLVKEVNTQITTKPNSNYAPLTDEQKAEMDDKSIENWEKKAKEGLLFNNSTMRELSNSIQSVMSGLLQSGVSYDDLEKMGITISDDYGDGGTIKFDEEKFKAAMTSDPEMVSNVFTGGGDVKKGLASVMEETLSPYATRMSYLNGGSYGKLIDEAGSDKIALSVTNNQIYKDLEEMQNTIDKLNERLKTEQDRYISQFTQMETLISQMNSQASYLSSLTG